MREAAGPVGALPKTEDIHNQDAHEKQQRDGAEQQVADIGLPVRVTVGKPVIGDESGDNQKDPVDHKALSLRFRRWKCKIAVFAPARQQATVGRGFFRPNGAPLNTRPVPNEQ